MGELPEEIRQAARGYDPSRINRYLTELAARFHRFYTACRIRDAEPGLLEARLVLADTVRSGYHLGTRMGTPTINMVFPEGVIVPRHGVYASKVYLEGGASYIAVTNVGVRPTVSDENLVSVESHLLDYSGNLYGRQARVEFYCFLRDEQRFESNEALSEQIHRDAEAAKAYFEMESLDSTVG